MIIFLLTILTVTLNHLYASTKNYTNKTKILIFIESIGNILILIPGGGLASPYVWYSLNTILIASIRLKRRFAWINLCIYLFAATIITAFAQGHFSDTLTILIRQSNIFIGLILVTALTQIITNTNKNLMIQKEKLIEANHRLIDANRDIKDHLFFIMNIYECVDVLTSQHNEESLKRMIVDYTKTITGSNSVAFVTNSLGDHIIFQSQRQEREEKFVPLIDKHFSDIQLNDVCVDTNGDGTVYILSLVKSDYKSYGVLCAELNNYNISDSIGELLNKIKFLSRVSAMGFGKIEVGELTEKLVADKERNRIADEIHDGVLQKLFGLSCYLFNASKKIHLSDKITIEKELKKFRISLDVAITELRKTIYGLSTEKDGNDSFSSDIEKLIGETKQLNDIDIKFKSSGDFGLLTTSQKKAFYRIICESISNSVRHGNATQIDMELSVLFDHISLKITDNGTGFDYENLSEERMGLGIRNMRHLIYSLNGRIEIKSEPGNGTRIIATVSKSGKYAS